KPSAEYVGDTNNFGTRYNRQSNVAWLGTRGRDTLLLSFRYPRIRSMRGSTSLCQIDHQKETLDRGPAFGMRSNLRRTPVQQQSFGGISADTPMV
ncbi:MAG: hypothetical protein Q9172_004977, partial [Xanthocarpia lactea]